MSTVINQNIVTSGVQSKPKSELAERIAQVLPQLEVGFAWEIALNTTISSHFANNFVLRLHNVMGEEPELVGSCLFHSMFEGEVQSAAEIIMKGQHFAYDWRDVSPWDKTGFGFYTNLEE